jgi:hypothetical protein
MQKLGEAQLSAALSSGLHQILFLPAHTNLPRRALVRTLDVAPPPTFKGKLERPAFGSHFDRAQRSRAVAFVSEGDADVARRRRNFEADTRSAG